MINQNNLHTDNSDNGNPTNKIRVVPSLGSKVTYEDSDRNEWKKAIILSRADKSSGVNKYWFTIKDLKDGSVKSVDFENIKSWKNLDKQVLLCKNGTFDIVETKLEELENWKTTSFIVK